MTTESDALREALFAQMSAPPLPEYSGDTVILRGSKMPIPNSVAAPSKRQQVEVGQ
jgi:hypothetical protein